MTKIFISHSSKNENYGNALVDLLIGVGISGEQIIFTSNDAYGIPIGQNIFNWLKNRINEKPYVLYLLSPEYYSSVACLNEMGAAWIVENEHTMIFTPDFKLTSYEFQNGALDPREIGFFINNQDRLTAFIESLKTSFNISKNPVLVNQKIRDFLKRIEPFQKTVNKTIANTDFQETTIVLVAKEIGQSNPVKKGEIIKNGKIQTDGISRFFSDLKIDKIKDEEVLLVHYIMETAKYKLGTGWQENNEIENIRAWEDIQGLNNTLSRNYSSALRRFEMRKLIEVSDVTSHGNPKEVRLIEKMQEELLDLPEDITNKIIEVTYRNQTDELPF